jgi:hypothetical protein
MSAAAICDRDPQYNQFSSGLTNIRKKHNKEMARAEHRKSGSKCTMADLATAQETYINFSLLHMLEGHGRSWKFQE